MMNWKWCERKRVRAIIIKYSRILVNYLRTERNDANLQTRKSQGLNSDLVPPDSRQRRKTVRWRPMNKRRPPCAHARHESAGSAQFQVPAALIARK